MLPLRGKLSNVYKDKKGDALESEQVLNILMSIGYNPKSKSPMDNLRIGKLMFLPDADVDGSHIASLLESVVMKYVPDMYQREMVYIVQCPEYIAESNDGKERYYADTQAGLAKAAGPKLGKLKQLHLKGLGEMSKPALEEVAFNPATRRILLISKPSKEDAKRFKQVMAQDVAVRKELLGV